MIVSRREFSKLGAMGLAAATLGDAQAQAGQDSGSDRRIGYAVIGLGRIADHFMRGALESKHSKITALVSGHRDKAERIAKQYGIPTSSIYSYEDMDRFRDNKSVDAVYVALPNFMHAEYTIRSAKAGKHVLCEKPMATTVAECEQMIAACKAANVKLMIAYRLHYEPLNLKAAQMIKDGLIGNVHSIHGVFGFNGPKGEWRLSRKFGGGGSLLDLGIYVINASRYLTGEEPDEFKAIISTPDKDGRFDVDENVSWVLKFPSGALATGASSYGTQMNGYYKVYGTKGFIEMNPSFNYDGLKLHAEYGGGHGTPPTIVDEENHEKDPAQFAHEADYFSECILNNKPVGSSDGEEGLKDMKYIEALYKSAGTYLGTS